MGLAFGDALGARYEGGILERSLWALIGKSKGRMKYTDDTQMSLDIINSILSCEKVDQDRLALQFANSYRWSRGYGLGAAKSLKLIKKGMPWNQANTSQFKDGSFGNGAAMRSPVLALFYSGKQLKEKVKLASVITHVHPEAIEGAYLIALSVSLSLQASPIDVILEKLNEVSEIEVFKNHLKWLGSFFYDGKYPYSDLTKWFGNGIEARNSCITAIAFALYFRSRSYLEMFDAIRKGKGDVDTIAAMVGAIWGAYNGFDAMTDLKLGSLESGETIVKLADQAFNFSSANEKI